MTIEELKNAENLNNEINRYQTRLTQTNELYRYDPKKNDFYMKTSTCVAFIPSELVVPILDMIKAHYQRKIATLRDEFDSL